MHDETMTTTRCDRASDVESLFLGKVRPEAIGAIYAHMGECSACTQLFETLATAELALFAPRKDRALSPASSERILARLEAGEPRSRQEQTSRFGLGVVGILASALASALVIVAIGGREASLTRAGDGVALRARGREGAPLSGQVTLRAIAVRTVEESVAVEDLAHRSVLAPGEHVKLIATSLGAFRWFSAVVYGSDGSLLHRIEPLELTMPAEDQTVGDVIPVAQTWPKGRLRIVAVFAADRASASDVGTAASAEDDGQRSVRVLEAEVGEEKSR